MNAEDLRVGQWGTVTDSNVDGVRVGQRFLRTDEVYDESENATIFGVFDDGDYYWINEEHEDGTFVEVEVDPTKFGDLKVGDEFTMPGFTEVFVKMEPKYGYVEGSGADLLKLLKKYTSDGQAVSLTDFKFFNFANSAKVERVS